MSENFISCPFCKEDDFDLIGLKTHLLNGRCEVFNVTDTWETLNELAKKCCGFKEESQ